MNPFLLQVAKFVLIIAIVFGISEYQDDLKALSASPQGAVESKYNSDKEGTSLTSQLATEDVVPINLLEHIYLVTTNDVAVISNDGKETKLKQGSFVLINDEKTKYSLDKHGTVVSMEGLAKVPMEIAKDNFYIQFALKDNATHGKVYREINALEHQVTKNSFLSNKSKYKETEILLYGLQVTRDLNLYEGKFIGFSMGDSGHFYVSEREMDWSIRSLRDLHLTSRYSNGHRVAQERIYDITLDITQPTHLSGAELNKALEGTSLAGLGDAFQHMEEKWGVNALFGVAVAAHESSWGNSHLARTRNNLFGIAAYDGNEGAAYSFPSMEACVDHWGEMIKDVYFNRGYTNLSSVNSIYASDQAWAHKVHATMSHAKSKILSNQ